MKLNLIAMAFAATAFAVVSAQAQVVIQENVTPNVVIKEKVAEPKVVIKERSTVGLGDCTTKTVKKTNEWNDRTKTVSKTKCD